MLYTPSVRKGFVTIGSNADSSDSGSASDADSITSGDEEKALKMVGSVGNIGVYDEDSEEFENYLGRIKLYFVANKIKENQVAIFLTLAGPKIYALAKSLLSPNDPAEESADSLFKVLTNHYKPKRIVIFERYTFYSRNQRPSENVTDFLAAIRALAHTCEFGTSLDDMLRDRLVMGLHNKETQHALLSEADLTLQRAVEVAIAREAATRDVEAMASAGVHAVGYEKKRQFKKPLKKGNQSEAKSGNAKADPPKKACSGCGRMHWKKDCPFKDAECYQCGKKDTLSLFAGIRKRGRQIQCK